MCVVYIPSVPHISLSLSYSAAIVELAKMDFTVIEGDAMEICANIMNSSSSDCPIQFTAGIAIITQSGTAGNCLSLALCLKATHDFLLESPGDYDVLSTATQIPACEDHVCVNLQAISDGRVEMDEMLEVLLQSAPGLDSSISTGGQISVTIKNNDSKLSCSQSSLSHTHILSHTHTYTHMLSHTHIHTLSHTHSLSHSSAATISIDPEEIEVSESEGSVDICVMIDEDADEECAVEYRLDLRVSGEKISHCTHKFMTVLSNTFSPLSNIYSVADRFTSDISFGECEEIKSCVSMDVDDMIVEDDERLSMTLESITDIVDITLVGGTLIITDDDCKCVNQYIKAHNIVS